MEVQVFEAAENYLAYHTSSRWTVGEEQDAINTNCVANDYIHEGESYSVYLSEGNIIVLDGATVKISIME